MDSNEQQRKDVAQADSLIKRRTRYGVRPKTASHLVNQLLSRHGIAQQQNANELQSIWDSVVGAKWNQLTRPANLKRGVLEIVVANSLVNQQLTFEKHKLLKSMQKLMPDMKLKDLRFRVGNVN
jgi:hypothetical protein